MDLRIRPPYLKGNAVFLIRISTDYNDIFFMEFIIYAHNAESFSIA